jgi:hypothetical protein
MNTYLLSILIFLVACSPDDHQDAISDPSVPETDQMIQGESMMDMNVDSPTSMSDQAIAIDLDGGSSRDFSMPQPDLDQGNFMPNDDTESNELSPEPADEAAYIYDQNVVHQFELILTPENMEILDRDPTAEQYVPGTLIFEGVTYDNIAVRYKGSVGAWLSCVEGSTPENPLNLTGAITCPKLSLKVSFNKYDSEGRFFGLKKLLFHAMNNDQSLMKERMGYWLFRHMGVAAPRANHVKVTLNGDRVGLYANVEYIDGRFTRSRFEDGKGNLYKEVWPTGSEFTGPVTATRLEQGLRTNEDESPSFANVLRFSSAMQGDSEARAQALPEWMDIDYLARFIAVDRAIAADDGPFHFYCQRTGCTNHNFYIYEEELGTQLWVIPWDLDHAFLDLTSPVSTPVEQFIKVIDEWHDLSVDCAPHPGAASWTPWQIPPNCDPLIRTYAEHFMDTYYDVLDDFVAGPFSPEVIENQLNVWSTQIASTVEEVHTLNNEHLSTSEWMRFLSDLKTRLVLLRENASIRD